MRRSMAAILDAAVGLPLAEIFATILYSATSDAASIVPCCLSRTKLRLADVHLVLILFRCHCLHCDKEKLLLHYRYPTSKWLPFRS